MGIKVEPVNIDSLINDDELLSELEKIRSMQKQFSDIVDSQGLQYVDLVMEGGGMLGIALVGYTWALEEAGLRFLGIGGTSAGSINALLLAALGTPADKKSPKLLDVMANCDFSGFVDGDDDSRDLISSWLNGAGNIKLAFKAVQVIDTLNARLGLNPGKEFLDWIKKILSDNNISIWKDLNNKLCTKPKGLKNRLTEEPISDKELGSKLAIVVADVSTETKVVFPENSLLYFNDPETVDPSLFVRASMSIPFFFEPLKISHLPAEKNAEKNWALVGYDCTLENGGLPQYAVFVDGGVMSNFPIDIFHVDTGTEPLAPTFGVKLEYDQRRHPIEGPFDLLGAIFNSARHCLDYDFLKRNSEYKMLVSYIPCKEYNWLDFNMSDNKKIGLFKEGAKKAIEFLHGFDWEAYKSLRKRISLN